MEKPISTPLPSEWQRATAQKIDEAFHAPLAKLSLGLSPIALVLAYADWALHLGIAPGRQLLLAQRALALWQQALSSAAPHGGAAADEAPVAGQDPRFSDPSWRQWPFSALTAGFHATDAWWHEAAQVDGVSRHHQHLLSLFNQQVLDALAPSNWILTNPEALKKGH